MFGFGRSQHVPSKKKGHRRSSDHERHRKEEEEGRKDSGTKTTEEKRPEKTSAKKEKSSTKGEEEASGNVRSDRRGTIASARAKTGKTPPAAAKAPKPKKEEPAQANKGGKNEPPKTADPEVMTGSDNWERKRLYGSEKMRPVLAGSGNASELKTETRVPTESTAQGTSDKAPKVSGTSTKKMRVYTEQLKKEMNENFKFLYRVGNDSIAVLSSETLRDYRRQMYGPGQKKFRDEEWKSGKLRLYTSDANNVLVLVPKDPEQSIRIQPVIPPSLESEVYKTWKCSATFNQDVFHVAEISREIFLEKIFNKPVDEAEKTLAEAYVKGL